MNAITTMPGRNFSDTDIVRGGIFCERADLVEDMPAWMKRGLQQTTSGYGGRLNSGLKIRYNGKLYRIYITCYSNSGSSWFTVRGVKIFVR